MLSNFTAMIKESTVEKDLGSEEKILEAARKLFTERGFAAVKTRDIAEEAGINLALLNYYFRSKEKLFDIIMVENFSRFLEGITAVLTANHESFDKKLVALVDAYITMLNKNPGIPLFVINEMHRHPQKMAAIFKEKGEVIRGTLFQHLSTIGGGKPDINPVHFLVNLMGLVVFPFAASPVLKQVGGMDNEAFQSLMEERKKLVPIWLKQMIQSHFQNDSNANK